MTRRVCIFCGNTPLTQEHVIPLWAGEVLHNDPRGIHPDSEHEQFKGASHLRWQSTDPVAFIAKSVCRDCNSGWMSDIEEAVTAPVSAMIAGRHITLNSTEQQQIGKWLCLKAIIEQYCHHPPDPVPQEWRDYFYRHRQPPPSWYAWLGYYDGTRPAYLAGGPMKALVRTPLTPFEVGYPAITTTIVIGYFAAKVFGTGPQVPLNPSPRALLQVWPPPLLSPVSPVGLEDETIAWPPPTLIDDELLEVLSQAPQSPPQPS